MSEEDTFAPEAHSTLRPEGGIAVHLEYPRANNINPQAAEPARLGLRYSLSPKVLGKLERLAKARFEIRELTDVDLKEWKQDREEPYWQIAQSVNASSEIEGEQIAVDKLTLLLSAATEPSAAFVDDELERRMAAIKAIYSTYLWALAIDRVNVMSFDFLVEIHKRMFEKTQPDIAGRLKERAVHIRGAGYDVKTLPPNRAEEFLRKLCERTNAHLLAARKFAEYSMFLTTAEFILDFLAIHPFADGNGRMARLLSTYLLEKSGYHFSRFYPLDNIILETREDYYNALFKAQCGWYGGKEDLTPWIDYYVQAVFVQWTRAYQRVRDGQGKEPLPRITTAPTSSKQEER